jgi:putative tryptophan/tyrosine transport system substrate-binding protein
MRRRDVLGWLAGVTALPSNLQAQPVSRTHRIGHITGGTATSRAPLMEAFMAGMGSYGYTNQNLTVEHRYAEDRFDRLPDLMNEILALQPDVIFASTTPAALAAKAATKVIPIVFVSVADPLGVGLVKTLSDPGSNITGITNIGAELAGKRLELLKELVPTATKVAVFINLNDQNSSVQMQSAKAAAAKLGVELGPVLNVRGEADLKGAFETAIRMKSAASLRMLDPAATTLRKQTVQQAAEFRMPVMYPFREDVSAGGLASYGPSLPDQYRQAAKFVDKIMKGSKPAELPVEQPTKFEIAINLRTAKTLGLAVSPQLLARADEVIE